MFRPQSCPPLTIPIMLRLSLIGLLFFLSLPYAIAQDTTIVLSNKSFVSKGLKPVDNVNLSSTIGWVYKPGHNAAWAQPELNTTGWTKRVPESFSAKDADANGQAEGWFRLRLRIDSTFNLLPLGLSSYRWAASEMYVNGKLVAAYGSTGTGEKPYAEYNANFKPGFPVQLEAGKVYLIAIHMVDYVFPFPPFGTKKLKSEVYEFIKSVIVLTRTQLRVTRFIKDSTLRSNFITLWLTVSFLLAILFWLLSTQELPGKNTIRLLAIVEILFVILTLSQYNDYVDISFTAYYIITAIGALVLWPILSVTMIAFLQIFEYHIPNKWIKISVLASLGLSILELCVGAINFLTYIACVCQQLVTIYVIITSWKRLKGAQWAVVAGVGFTGLFISLIIIFNFIKTAYPIVDNIYIAYMLVAGFVLSLPLSFWVYLALRFKETLIEVRTNAAALVLANEEKRDLLASQNERLEQQVEARTAELKASQQQLIQKEKMASLGELTAGIAHEIQNPLNFVNNFSEVSTELVTELDEEQRKPDRDAELEAEILIDLKQNLQKITLHGGRASGIVKGMLEHARTHTGEKRLTDLNALADEYLKMAYHGLRAKDKNFKAELKTDFGHDIGFVEVVPQEIGRVLLNLYNNAFYAVQQQQRVASADYQPTVTVSTTQSNGHTEIWVSDNGTGMPQSVKAKIFQPFFTTKPTGEGTGLGLSLSYDIVTKGHNGSLLVESQAGEGTQFVLQLPVLG